jgi:serine protease Do
VQNLTPEIAESLGIEGDTQGVVVTGIEPGSAAESAQLQRGDVILEVNRESVPDVSAFRDAVSGTKKGKSVLLLVRRGDSTIFLTLKPRPD